MKNKLMLAAALLMVGGFALGDASSMDLLARVRPRSRPSVTPTQISSAAKVCIEAFDASKEIIDRDTRILNERLKKAKDAKEACLKRIGQGQNPSVRPSPSPRR